MGDNRGAMLEPLLITNGVEVEIACRFGLRVTFS